MILQALILKAPHNFNDKKVTCNERKVKFKSIVTLGRTININIVISIFTRMLHVE